MILDGLRTPIGSKGRSLRDISAVELGAGVTRALLERRRFLQGRIDEVILGNVVGGGLGQNPARQVAFRAGLSVGIPAFTVNKVCGSGLKAVVLAAQAIRLRDARVVLAGGIESASQSPCAFPRGKNLGALLPHDTTDTLVHDGLLCALSGILMGEIAEETARKFKISRRQQDEYALESHRRAALSAREDFFGREIVPVKHNGRVLLDHDEKPRPALSLDILSKLPPAFKAGGSVTAGNSSDPADAAAALLLASARFAREHRLKPQARILGYAAVATDPRAVFTASTLAMTQCLKRCGLKKSDIDVFEVNEAFAVQAILTLRLMKIDIGRFNPFGGAVALGHPLGVSGSRGLVTLMNILRLRREKIGMTSVCLGGGEALAMAIRMA